MEPLSSAKMLSLGESYDSDVVFWKRWVVLVVRICDFCAEIYALRIIKFVVLLDIAICPVLSLFCRCCILWLPFPNLKGCTREKWYFSLEVTLGFRVYTLTNFRSEALFIALVSDPKQSQITAVDRELIH